MIEYKAGLKLEQIQIPSDMRSKFTIDDLPEISDEVRQYIVDVISEIGNSHFGASLGVVELTVALHYVFNTLSSTSTQVDAVGGSSTTSTSSNTYAEGESSDVYLITESKGKSLILTSTEGNSSTSGSSTSSSTNSTTITLSQN